MVLDPPDLVGIAHPKETLNTCASSNPQEHPHLVQVADLATNQANHYNLSIPLQVRTG